jgi:hypothetical protein
MKGNEDNEELLAGSREETLKTMLGDCKNNHDSMSKSEKAAQVLTAAREDGRRVLNMLRRLLPPVLRARLYSMSAPTQPRVVHYALRLRIGWSPACQGSSAWLPYAICTVKRCMVIELLQLLALLSLCDWLLIVPMRGEV